MQTSTRSDTRVGRPTVAGALLGLSWTVLAALVVLFAAVWALGATVPLRTRSLVYLGLMLSVSLAHGGYEHVENLRGRGEGFQVRYLAAYLGLTGVALGLFFLAPVTGLAAALAITVLKGGHGGLQALEQVGGTGHLRSRTQRALAVAVRGGAVLVPPYLFHDGLFYMVASYMVGVFDPGALASARWAFAPRVRWTVGAVFALALVGHLALGSRRATDRRGWRLEAGETLLLVVFFAVVPPVVAIGVYFPLWYATRQVARFAAASGTDRPLSEVPLRRRLRAFARKAALPWLGALVLLWATTRVVPNPPADPTTWVGYYSVFVAVIAVPHVVVGAWLDRRQGIWATD